MDPKYASIINKPHHVSKRHPQMPPEKRAAQFRPVNMVGLREAVPPEIREYWDWDGDQSHDWTEDGDALC